jgi:hypothetical protein
MHCPHGLGLDHIFIRLGPALSHASFTAPVYLPALAWGNFSLLGTNGTTPGHWSHWVPLACEATASINLGMMKLMSTWIIDVNLLFWPGIVTLVPTEEEIPRRCRQEDQAVKEVWEGRRPAEWRCHLAQDLVCIAHMCHMIFVEY